MTGGNVDQEVPRRGAAADIRYLLVVSRPRFWLYLAGPVLVGVAFGADGTASFLSAAALALFGYFLVPANVYLYGINDIFDRDVDAENPKKEDREVRYDGRTAVPAAVVVSGLAAVPLFGVLSLEAAVWVLAFLALGAAYSAPPLRLKTVPPLDSAVNGLYVLPGVAAFAAVAGHQAPAVAVLGGWTWAMGMHTFSAIPDVEPDRAAGIETTATWLGVRNTFRYCAGCWLVAALAFAALDVRFLLVFGWYPLIALGTPRIGASVDRVYWWFPWINTAAGAALTIAGLWVTVHG